MPSTQVSQRARSFPPATADTRAQGIRVTSGRDLPPNAISMASHHQPPYSPSPSPITILNAGNHDPFDSTPLELDPLAIHLIAFITTHHASMIWPLEFSVEKDISPTKQAWKYMVRDIVLEQAQLASFLAFGAALKLQIHGRPDLPPGDVQALDSIIWRNKSIAHQSIVHRLESDATDSVVLSTVLHLLCLEMYVPDLAVARTHLRALESITLAIGGVSELAYIHREYFLSISLRAAYVLNEALPVEITKWDGETLRGQTLTWIDPSLAIEISRLLSQSHEISLDLYPLCDEDLAGLVEELREILVVEELRDMEMQDAEKYLEVYRWIRPRVVSTRYRMCRLGMTLSGLLTQAVEAFGIVQAPLPGEWTCITLPTNASSTSRPPLIVLRNTLVCLGATFCAATSLYRGREKLDYWGIYVEWEKWLFYCLDNYLALRPLITPSVGPVQEAAPTPVISASEEEYADLEIVLWATVAGAIAHPMQRSTSLEKLNRFDSILRQLMSLLGLQTYAEVRNVCKRLVWHDSVMDPALRNIMRGGL